MDVGNKRTERRHWCARQITEEMNQLTDAMVGTFTLLTHIFNYLYYLSFSVQAPCLDCLITPSCKLFLAFLSLLSYF